MKDDSEPIATVFFFRCRCELIEDNIYNIYDIEMYNHIYVHMTHTCRRPDIYLCIVLLTHYTYIYIFADVSIYMYTYTQVLPTQNQVHTHIDLFKVPTMSHYIENKSINILCTLDIRASPFQSRQFKEPSDLGLSHC